MTQSDKELLELAAKAAGEKGQIVQRPYGGISAYALERYDGTFWIPQHNDGDALRLAVQTGMFSDVASYRKFQAFYRVEISGDEKPSVATRRAITSAAAEIGAAMPKKCYPRKQFPTKEAAATAASAIYQRNKQHRLPYPCSECRKWHLSISPMPAIHRQTPNHRSTPI